MRRYWPVVVCFLIAVSPLLYALAALFGLPDRFHAPVPGQLELFLEAIAVCYGWVLGLWLIGVVIQLFGRGRKGQSRTRTPPPTPPEFIMAAVPRPPKGPPPLVAHAVAPRDGDAFDRQSGPARIAREA